MFIRRFIGFGCLFVGLLDLDVIRRFIGFGCLFVGLLKIELVLNEPIILLIRNQQ